MHPITGLFLRAHALLTKVLKLIECGQLDFKLQGGGAMGPGQWDENAGTEPALVGSLRLSSSAHDRNGNFRTASATLSYRCVRSRAFRL